MNYLTAQFALATRGQLQEGETVLVHGAAGGVGTATIQVAKGYGARVIAVVSTEGKAAGRHGMPVRTRRSSSTASSPRSRSSPTVAGVDVVVDVVGGDLMTDSLRALAPLGRVLVVGFTAGAIPEVKVNRLLLNNIDVRGVGWGAYAMVRPGFMRKQWDALVPMMESGAVNPPIGRGYPLEDVRQALTDMAERRATGKSVLTLR